MMMDEATTPQKALPLLSYPSGSGHSPGSDTSAARERNEDGNGTTADAQRRVLDVLYHAPAGRTWREIDEATRINHHGRTSSALTHLRKAGEVFWLNAQRDGCHLFVHKMWRDKYQLADVKPEPIVKTNDEFDAARQVCQAVDAYFHDPTVERWDHLKDVHAVWSKL